MARNDKNTEAQVSVEKDPTPQGTGDNPEGKVKVRHENMKGKKITLPHGEIVAFDENGILEINRETAEYLLSIPGYEKG
jgi:hypothetical protein